MAKKIHVDQQLTTELVENPQKFQTHFNLPEYAFVGRSNVGKSSLINMLIGKKEIARISSTPGKTKTIYYYEVNKSWMIVDVPGYGYAKVSKKLRTDWITKLKQYLIHSQYLSSVILLIDSRIDLQDSDEVFMTWMAENNIPFILAQTKIDKLKSLEFQKRTDELKSRLQPHWLPLPQIISTSAKNRTGRNRLLEFIQDTNAIIDNNR